MCRKFSFEFRGSADQQIKSSECKQKKEKDFKKVLGKTDIFHDSVQSRRLVLLLQSGWRWEPRHVGLIKFQTSYESFKQERARFEE